MGDLYDSANQLIAVDYSCKELHIQKPPLRGISLKVMFLNFKSRVKKYLKL